MPSKAHRSVIASARVFVISVCVLLSLLAVWNNWRARETQLEEARNTAMDISQALVQHADDTFKEADIALLGLSERLDYGGRGPAAMLRLERFMSMQVAELTQLDGLFVMDANGDWLVATGKLIGTRFNSRERPYFLYHERHTDTLAHIAAPIQSRVSGEWVVTISRRLNKPDGSFDGIVMAAIKLSYFTRFYETFKIGNEGALLLASNDGAILVRRPMRNDSIGKSLENASIFRDYAAKTASGTASIRSAQDGITRINSYQHLNHYPLFVAAALSKQEVLASWQSDVYLHALGLITLIVVLSFFGNRLIAQIKLRVAAERIALNSRAHAEELNQSLQRLAMHDGLTGLANRRCFDQEIIKELHRAARIGEPLALVMLDVDYFKRYNDRYGHVAGDECLRQIAAASKKFEQRPGDLVARYGGEEIVVLLPHCNAESAAQIAGGILSSIAALRIEHVDNPPGVVTASAGVAVLNRVDQPDDAENIINMADQALYLAKSSGRNRVCIYGGNPPMTGNAEKRIEVETSK